MPETLIRDTANKIPPRFNGESPNDVFLMVKAYVSDVDLCQPVLVVWPGTTASDCMATLQKIALNDVPGFLA